MGYILYPRKASGFTIHVEIHSSMSAHEILPQSASLPLFASARGSAPPCGIVRGHHGTLAATWPSAATCPPTMLDGASQAPRQLPSALHAIPLQILRP